MEQVKSKLKGKEKAKPQIAPKNPSSNWRELQKIISSSSDTNHKPLSHKPPRKKRRLDGLAETRSEGHVNEAGGFIRGHQAPSNVSTTLPRDLGKGSLDEVPEPSNSSAGGKEAVEQLRKMVLGQIVYSEGQEQPGKYLAMDCEMVGVGLDGSESSLARVSLVNYNGAIVLDEFVRQRERVVDYRTGVSGIRETDMIRAKPFSEVQKKVAELLKDRILVGHAVFNDLKALLLSHPRQLTRDTQQCAGKAKLLKTKYPALRKLVHQELGLTIQAGEHSSVTDARATMAVYRLHRKEWDKGFRPLPATPTTSKKRKASDTIDNGKVSEEQDSDYDQRKKTSKAVKVFPGGGRKGVSSGLSTVLKRPVERIIKKGPLRNVKESSDKWWATLNGTPSKGSKGAMRISSAR